MKAGSCGALQKVLTERDGFRSEFRGFENKIVTGNRILLHLTRPG